MSNCCKSIMIWCRWLDELESDITGLYNFRHDG
jgi:hypothetical protein